VAGARFEIVDTLDGAEIDGVDGETIEGARGQRDYVAAVEAADDLIDELGLGFVGMDEESFSRQYLAPVLSEDGVVLEKSGEDPQTRTIAYRCGWLNFTGSPLYERRGVRMRIAERRKIFERC